MIKYTEKEFVMINLTTIHECIFKPILHFDNNKSIVYIEIIKIFLKNSSEKGNKIKFNMVDFINVLPIKEKEKDIFPLIDIFYSLENRQIKITFTKKTIVSNLGFSVISYFKTEGDTVEIEIVKKVNEAIFLLNLKNIDQLYTYSLFTKSYSSLIYYLINLETNNDWSISLIDLRTLLGLKTTQYKSLSDFKKIVLHPALSDINAVTSTKIDYEYLKAERKIIFTWEKIDE